MRTAKALVAALLFVLLGTAEGQQKGSIRGVARDASNGETLPGANVVIDSLRAGTATDKSGYFILSGVLEGTYVLLTGP